MSLYMPNCTQPIQIMSSSTQNFFNTLKYSRFHSTTSTWVFFNSNDLNTLKCAQLHSRTLNHHSIVWNIHSSIRNIPINTYNLQMCPCTPTTLQSLNFEHRSMLQTCTNALPTWNNPKSPPNTKTLNIHSLTN
jgi:hypothetical protein